MKRVQAGFTLIELVVVILILSILTATALPKFLDLSDDAHSAVVDGTGAAIRSGVALYHAGWIAAGSPATAATLGSFGTGNQYHNTAGWPIGTDNNLNQDADCDNFYAEILQQGASSDFTAGLSGTTCTFTYGPVSGMSIAYDSSDGSITVDSTP